MTDDEMIAAIRKDWEDIAARDAEPGYMVEVLIIRESDQWEHSRSIYTGLTRAEAVAMVAQLDEDMMKGGG